MERVHAIRLAAKNGDYDGNIAATKKVIALRTAEEWARDHEAAERGYNQLTVSSLLFGTN